MPLEKCLRCRLGPRPVPWLFLQEQEWLWRKPLPQGQGHSSCTLHKSGLLQQEWKSLPTVALPRLGAQSPPAGPFEELGIQSVQHLQKASHQSECGVSPCWQRWERANQGLVDWGNLLGSIQESHGEWWHPEGVPWVLRKRVCSGLHQGKWRQRGLLLPEWKHGMSLRISLPNERKHEWLHPQKRDCMGLLLQRGLAPSGQQS